MTWREGLRVAMKCRGEELTDLVSNTLSDDEMDEIFDDGYGRSEGRAFTAWSADHVYFPVVYDGSEWVGSVPRNPNGECTRHIGGE